MKEDTRHLQRVLTPSQRLMLEHGDFSLVLGGPLYQLLRRSHLSDDAFELVMRRVLVISLFAWFPLLLLSAIAGQVWNSATQLTFLLDAEVHVRFLVAMPLLITAELVVHKRMRPVVRQFTCPELIPAEEMHRFDAAIAAVFRLRNSTAAELVLTAIVYGVGVLV